jgi:hypothetical protein
MGWFKSLFESRNYKNGRLSVEHLEIRLTPDANAAIPAFNDFAIGIYENNCSANSITIIDDIRLQQNLNDYRSSQIYFCSNDSINFSASAFQSVNKLDYVALQSTATKGVVLIDSSLIATIPIDELKGSLVVSIDGNRNVISQITTALEGLSNVPVLRIISHGNDGVLYFGNQAFDSKDLSASAMQVASWGNSLTADADILLYGCSIASTDAGKAFVLQLASITQADIGASTNLTGKGGDGDLEFQVGQVSNALIATSVDYERANLTLELGDSFDTAIPLAAIMGGFGADGNISVDGEEDYYTFTATATGSLQASLDQINGSSIDTYIRIYDSSRTLVASDDDSGSGLNSLASISVVAGNVYYIKVTGTSYGSTGAYRVATSISSNPGSGNAQPSGTSFETAIPLVAIMGGFGADGNISVDGEEDYYTFTATATGLLGASLDDINYSGIDPYLRIYDSSRTLVASDDDSGPGLNSLASVSVVAGNVYYIKATGTSYGSTGAYRVATSISSNPGSGNAQPSGTSFETAIALTAVTGGLGADENISVAGEEDYFTFTATATGLLRASLDQNNGSSIDTYIRVYDSSRTLIASDDDSGPGLNSLASVSVVAGNVYYIKASAYGPGTGAYRVATSIASISNPSNTQASGISFNEAIVLTAVTGGLGADENISVAGEEDYFTFTATATGLLRASLDQNNGSSIDTYIRVYDSSRTLIASDDDSGPGLNSLASVSVVAGNTFYIKASAYGPGTGAYRVTTSIASISGQGDTFDTAMIIIPDSVTNIASADGNISVAGEEDFYKYTASANGVVTFSMDAISNSGVDTYISVYDSSRNLVAQDDDSGPGLNSLASGISVSANSTYYIKTTAYGAGTGAYRVSVSAISNSGSGNAFGNPVTLSTNADGDILVAGEEDFYKYTASASGVVTFSMDAINNSGVDTYIRVYDSSRNLVAQDDDSGLGLNSLASVSVIAGNDYYIKATAYGMGTGAYRVSVSSQNIVGDDVGNLLDASATLLTFTGEIASQTKTISYMDFDVFSFTASVSGRYEIGVIPDSTQNLAPYLEVVGSDGSFIGYASAHSGLSAFTLPLLSQGQQVYIRVSGSQSVISLQSSTGNYTLQVKQPGAIVDFYANSFNSGTSQIPVEPITLSLGTNSGSLTNANMVIESANDVDVFRFTANRSGPMKVNLSKNSGSTLDTIISILDSSGNVLASNDDSNSSTNSEVVIDVNNLGVYYVSVKGYGGTTGDYHIDLQDLTPTNLSFDGDGIGNDFTKATTLGFVNGVASAASDISVVGDRDVFKIVATANGVLAFSLQARASSGLDSYLYLYDSNENLLARDDDSGSGVDSLINWSVHTGEIYYLQAAAYGTGTGAYTVSATISAGDDHADLVGDSASRLIVSNNAATGSGIINSAADDDVFSFVATSSGSITINVSANASALDTYLFVYNSTGDILLDYNDDITSTNPNSSISLQVIDKEKYYFMVSGYGDSVGTYNLSVTSVADTGGNSIALSTTLSFSNNGIANQDGSIEVNGDADFYKLAIGSDGRYSFNASASISSNGLDTTIAVYSENGRLLGENDDISTTPINRNSSLELNLYAGDIVYLKVAGFGVSTGNYHAEVQRVSNVITDDFGGTIQSAFAFPLDNAHSYNNSSASIQFAGDTDVFHGVADISGNITLMLTPDATLQANIRAFVHRNGENIQVGSVNGSALGGVVNLTFPVFASEDFYVEISGNANTRGHYAIALNNLQATNTSNALDVSVIDRAADELRDEFTRIVAEAGRNSDINATSQVIMTQLLEVIHRLIPGFTGLIGFFDPVDLTLTGSGGTVSSQGSNSTISNPSASLSSRGALDLVVIPGAAAGQYNLQMSGTGGGQVLAGVAMVGANGQVINPTITGGQSSGGIAASNVPKTGLNLVLDFGSNSGGGNGNGGGGNGGNGGGGNSNGGDTAQSGPVAGSTTASASASASASSASPSTASAATGLTSLAALANAITQSATASGAGSTTSAASLANLASLALGLGSTAATLDEKQLAKDLGGDAPAGDLDLSGSDDLKTSGSFVLVTFAQAYQGFNQAVFSTLDAEKQVVTEITNIFDKVLPALVPSEFENSVENLLLLTKKSLFEDGKAALLKTGDILADIIMSKLVKNLPATQPAKNKVDAKVPSFEFVVDNLVPQNKNESATEEICFGDYSAIADRIPHCFEEILNSVNRNTLDDSLSGPSNLRNYQQNKTAQALGIIAGVLLAPGVLSSTYGTQAPAFEKPKPRKQKS